MKKHTWFLKTLLVTALFFSPLAYQSNATITPSSVRVYDPVTDSYVTVTPAGEFKVTGTVTGGQLPATLGQKTMANSLSTVIASDQSAIPVTGAFYQATQPVSGTFFQATQPVSGTFFQATQPVSGPLTDTQLRASAVPVSGTFFQATQPVSAASLPLPSGASTSALQTTGNASLSNIDTKIPALGQALAASSVPVVLTAAQLSTLTPLSSVAVTQSTSPWVVNQTQMNGVAVSTGNGVVGTGVQRVAISSDNTAFTVNAAQSGTWNVTNVSGTVSLPTGASTAAKQPALGTAGAASADVISVQGIASMTALKVDGSAVTQPISGSLTNISGTISLPTGASTSALQTTGNMSLSNIDAGIPAALGQTTMTGSMPVALASNQSSIPVAATQTGAWTTGRSWNLSSGSDSVEVSTITNPVTVTGTVNSNIFDSSGSSIVNGQQAMTASVPVVLASDHTPITVWAGDHHGTGVSGQQVSGDSFPVVIASDQSALTVTGTVTVGSGAVTTDVGGPIGSRDSGTAGTQSYAVGGLYHTSGITLGNGSQASLQFDVNGRLFSIDKSTVAQASTTSGQYGQLGLGAVTTAAPSYTTAQSSPFSLNTSGGLRVDGSAVTQPISGSLTNISGTISLPTGAATETSLAKLTQTQGSTTSGQSGTLTQGAVTTAAPSYTTAQTSPFSLTTAGALRTDKSSIAGTTTSTGNGVVGAGVQRVAIASDNTAFSVNAAQSGTWNVTNVSGTVSLPTGASTETTVAKLTQTQGSTTSGQSGPLVQGAVTTGVPTYTTAQTSPFSLTTKGTLRSDISTVAGNTISTGSGVSDSGTLRVMLASNLGAIPIDIQGLVGTEPDAGIGSASSGTLRVSVASDNPLPASTGFDTFTTTSNGNTINKCYKNFGLQVVQTGTVTSWDVRLEGSLDGTTFTQIIQHTNATGSGVTVWSGANNYPVCYFRSRAAGLVLGLGTNVKAYIVGSQ